MSLKSNVRRLPTLSSLHIPVSHRRYQNRAAAVYDMSIDCHDMGTVCHIHRLSESIIVQDWKGNFDYLQSKLNLSNRKEIRKRFLKIIKEIQEDNIQPTLGSWNSSAHWILIASFRLLAAVAHHIPFVYVEQALADQDISNAFKRFLDDFNPKRAAAAKPQRENLLTKQLIRGQPVLTSFEQHLLIEYLLHSARTSSFRGLKDIEQCLLTYIQRVTTINYSSAVKICHLDRVWLKGFLKRAQPQMNQLNISWLNVDEL